MNIGWAEKIRQLDKAYHFRTSPLAVIGSPTFINLTSVLLLRRRASRGLPRNLEAANTRFNAL